MKIGIEAQRIFRPKKHGMDIVALEMIRALQRIDLENEYFIFVRPDSDRSVLEATPNFHIVEVSASSYPIWEQVALPRAARKKGVDILHCTSNTAPIAGGIPLVLTLHDIIYLEKIDFSKGTWYQRMGNLYRKWVVPSIVHRCKKIITVSVYEKEVIDRYFPSLPPDRVQSVYNGVGAHFRPDLPAEKIRAVKEQYQLPDRFVFFIGNTDPKKNVPNAMRALKIMKNRGCLDFKLVMPDYNKSHLEQTLQSIGAPDLIENIQLTGYVNNADLPVFYLLARAFLYPSLRESFGIPMLEAMACGTPVVTSTTSSMPEVSGGAALLADPNEPAQIAEALEKAIRDESLRAQLIAAGLENAARFSWENTAREVLECYRSVGSRATGSMSSPGFATATAAVPVHERNSG
jgi:glycosyltransferase involved in cell wall biosynthesis